MVTEAETIRRHVKRQAKGPAWSDCGRLQRTRLKPAARCGLALDGVRTRSARTAIKQQSPEQCLGGGGSGLETAARFLPRRGGASRLDRGRARRGIAYTTRWDPGGIVELSTLEQELWPPTGELQWQFTPHDPGTVQRPIRDSSNRPPRDQMVEKG